MGLCNIYSRNSYKLQSTNNLQISSKSFCVQPVTSEGLHTWLLSLKHNVFQTEQSMADFDGFVLIQAFSMMWWVCFVHFIFFISFCLTL